MPKKTVIQPESEQHEQEVDALEAIFSAPMPPIETKSVQRIRHVPSAMELIQTASLCGQLATKKDEQEVQLRQALGLWFMASSVAADAKENGSEALRTWDEREEARIFRSAEEYDGSLPAADRSGKVPYMEAAKFIARQSDGARAIVWLERFVNGIFPKEKAGKRLKELQAGVQQCELRPKQQAFSAWKNAHTSKTNTENRLGKKKLRKLFA